MEVWTVILAGVLLAALPNLVNGALEDAGVFVTNNYTKFERRVLPAKTNLVCYIAFEDFEWFRINKFEPVLLDFEKGNNGMNATFSLGTPTMLFAMKSEAEFGKTVYCKYPPKAYHNATMLANEKVLKLFLSEARIEYFAVRINDTERATIKKGWKYLLNVVKNRFPNNKPTNYEMLVVEKTALGVIYVGVVQDY